MPVEKRLPEKFVAVSNEIARDSALSPRAVKLLLYGLSRPPGWIFRRSELISGTAMAKNTIKRAVEELRQSGYITGNFQDNLTFFSEKKR